MIYCFSLEECSVYFPDLPGCISYGNSYEEAQKEAADALALHIYGMEKDGDEIPAPSKTPQIDEQTAPDFVFSWQIVMQIKSIILAYHVAFVFVGTRIEQTHILPSQKTLHLFYVNSFTSQTNNKIMQRKQASSQKRLFPLFIYNHHILTLSFTKPRKMRKTRKIPVIPILCDHVKLATLT